MTNIQLLSLKPVLDSLSVYPKEIQGNVISIPYKFSGKTKLKIAKNIRILNTLLNDMEIIKQSIIAKHSKGEEILINSPEHKLVDTEFNKVLNQNSNIELSTFTEDELFLDENPITANNLAILLNIIS